VTESFECSGLWWLPDNSEDRVAGVLRFSPEDGLVLNLLGMLGSRGGGVGIKSYEIVFGSVYDSPMGQTVTLKGCRLVRYTETFSGINAEGYRADLAFFGQHLKDSNDFLFSECDVGTSALSDWVAPLTGFQVDVAAVGGEWRLHYVPPEPLIAELPSGVIKLVLGAKTKSTLRNRTIEEEVRFRITTREPIGEQEWNDQYVFPLLNFLTLATDVSNALTRWEFEASEGSFRVKVLPRLVVTRIGKKEEALQPLIPLDGGKFPRLVVGWLDVHKKYRDSCNVFFALRYAPGPYTDMRFLGISQALVLYQAKRMNVDLPVSIEPPSEVMSQLPPKTQEQLRSWAKDLMADSFRRTIAQLAEEHQKTLLPLAQNNVEKLVECIMSFRNYVLYRAAPRPKRYTAGLYLVTETLFCLMKSCFLAELGYAAEERAALFQANAMYQFLCRIETEQ